MWTVAADAGFAIDIVAGGELQLPGGGVRGHHQEGQQESVHLLIPG